MHRLLWFVDTRFRTYLWTAERWPRLVLTGDHCRLTVAYPFHSTRFRLLIHPLLSFLAFVMLSAVLVFSLVS